MPDVGILNLQIHDDSAKAAEGLSKLVAKLKEMKEATTGIKLATVASGLKRINEALGKIDTGAVDKLNAITAALEKLGNVAGNVGGIKISFGSGKSQDLGALAEQTHAARVAAAQATSGFEELKSSVQEISAQDTAIAISTEDIQKANEQLDFSKFDPSKLPLGALGMQISDTAKEMYKWGDAVKDSFESVQQMKSSELLNSFRETEAAMKASNSAMQDFGASTNEAAEGFENISSGIQEISELDRTMKDVSTNIDSVGQSAQEAAPELERLDDAIEFARKWNASSGASANGGADIESAKRYLEEFNAIANTNERIEELTTKLGLAITKYDKELSKGTPNESTLNGLALQINGLIRQIDTLNSKSVNLDFAKNITPEGLDELSKIDRLILKREELIRTLHEEMEANKLSIPQMMTRQNQIDELTEKIERLKEKEEEEHAARLSIRETNEMAQRIGQIDLLIEKSEEAKAAYNALINDPNSTNGERLAAALKINKAELDIKQYNELQGLLANVSPEVQKFAKEQLDAGVSASTLKNKLFDLDGELKQKKGDLRDVADETKSLKQSFLETMFGAEGLKGAFKRMFPTISGLLSRFKQLVKYRMLRAVIRQIAEGFREGTENYYRYSQAIGGEFATKMDNAATALLQMKNSVGAAAAPLISSLIPYLQMAVDWFINIVNYANQFVALLRGQTTWSRAVPKTTKAFEDQTKAAKKAGAAVKDLLADWDELNIIQSESGGGSGAAGTSAAEDYLNMFEEVSEYEDAVKSIGNIFKNTFGDALEAAKLIGAAILGWKVNKAFGGILGKLGRIATGIVLEIVGVELAYNSGFDAGLNGWNEGNIIGAVGGSLATALGGFLITSALGFGGGVGLAIGLGVGIVATLYGYIKGQQKAADAVKWGNLHLTAEEVKEYVRKQFTFDVTAEIDALHTSITDMRGAKEEADAKITEFEKTLKEAEVNISMGVNSDPNGTTVQDALTSAQEAVKSLQGLITSTNTGIEIGLKYLPMTDSEGNDISSQFLESVEVAETPLKDYLFGLGKDMAKAMYDGEAAGWDEGTTKAAIDLMEKQKRIVERAKELENDRKFNESINKTFDGVVKDGVFDRETAEAAFAEQKKQIDEWTEAARTQAREYAANLEYLADLAQSAAEVETENGNYDVAAELTRSAEELRTKAKERIEQVETDIEAKLKKTKENIGNQWAEMLSSVYGEDVGSKIKEKIAHTQYGDGGYYVGYILDEITGLGHETDFGKVLKKGGTAKQIAEGLKEVFAETYRDLGNAFSFEYQAPSIVDEILDEFVGNPLDLMDSDAKKQLKQALIDYYNDESFGTDVYNNLFDIHTEVPVEVEPVPEIVGAETTESFDFDAEGGVVDVPIEFSISTEEQQALRDAIESAMSDGMMDTSEAMDLMFRYGWSNYENMLKELQYNLDEEGRNRGMMNRPIGMIASAGVSDVGGGRPDLYRPVVTPEPEDDQRQVNNTATGVQMGVGNLYDALQSILRVAEAISRKEFTVNVTPSTAAGAWAGASTTLFEKAHG